MSDKIKITAVNRIEGGGNIYNPGDSLDCEKQEALRLIGLGAAKLPVAELAETIPESTGKSLLDLLAEATTYEEVLALMPEEEPTAEIAAAFEEKLKTLKG
jgi:hypothetical protein